MEISKLPLVSICIPTYNGESYLVECLNSAINQTYKNIEIIISDDNSKDKTLQIVKDLKSKTDISFYVFNHQPNGIGANWNNCIKNSNGEYIKFLFQDDVLYSNCITDMINLATTDENLGLIYARRSFIYKEKNSFIEEFINFYGDLHTYWKTLIVESGFVEGTEYLKDKAILNSPKNKIGEPTSVLLKKDCFNVVGYFNEQMHQALDCEYWYRLMPFYKIGFIDKPLSSFRIHDKQASAINKSKSVNETQLLYKTFYEKLYAYLHPDCQWKLKKRFNIFLNTLVKLKASLKNFKDGRRN